MDHAAFWDLIDRARAKGNQAKSLVAQLARLPAAEMVEFDAWFSTYYTAINRRDLWAAIGTIQGGCSDDGFDYARAWLIGMGERVLLEAVRDPETLARFEKSGMSHENLMSIADAAHREVFGEPLPKSSVRFEVPDVATWPDDRVHDYKWNAETIRKIYPQLYATYLEASERDRPRGAIDHARFWELIASARSSGADFANALKQQLIAGPDAEAIGFVRWARAYNEALMREGVRDACRVLRGDIEPFVLLGFRGWLVAQGLEVVTAVVADPDVLATLATNPAASCNLLDVASDACSRKGILGPDWDDAVELDRAGWPPDLPRLERYTPAALRERLPRLTAGRDDAALDGDCDPRTLDDLERERRANHLFEQAKRADDLKRALAFLDHGLALLPPKVPGRIMDNVLRNLAATLLGRRARIHDQLGARPAAFADVEVALAFVPGSQPLLELRDKIQGVVKRVLGPPKRVHHAKFGDGAVIAIQGDGTEKKLVIDFADGRKTLLARFVEVLE